MYTIAPELKERILALVKFSNEKWTLESMQKGTLYLNTLEYFRSLEEKLKVKGMGDVNEGRFVLNNLDLKICDNETGNLVFTGMSKQSFITAQEDSEKHVLCTSYIDFGSLEIFEEGEDYFKANIAFTEEEKGEFKKYFGEYALIISFADFINNIKAAFKEQGIDSVSGKVKYSDFSTNYMDRLNPFIHNNSDKYFWKDLYFKNQKEYRLVVLNRDSKKPIEIKIGDMSKYSFITTTDELFNNRFCIESHFNPEKDLIEIE